MSQPVKMTADVFCIRIITNDYSLSVKDNIHDACFQYQICCTYVVH